MATFVIKNPNDAPSTPQGILLRNLCGVDIRPISQARLNKGVASEYITLAKEDPEEVRTLLLQMGAEDKRVSKGGDEAKIFADADKFANEKAIQEPEGNLDAHGKTVEFMVVLSFEPGTGKMARYVKTFKGGESLGVGKPGVRLAVSQFGENVWQADAYATAFAKYMRLYHSLTVNILHQQ